MKIYTTKFYAYCGESEFEHLFSNIDAAYKQMEIYINWFTKHTNFWDKEKENALNRLKEIIDSKETKAIIKFASGIWIYLNEETIPDEPEELLY